MQSNKSNDPRYLVNEVLYEPGLEYNTFEELYAQEIAQKTIYENHRAAFYHIFRYKGQGNYHYINKKKVIPEDGCLLLVNQDILQRYSRYKCKGDMILFAPSFFRTDLEKNDFLNTCELFQTDYVLIHPYSEDFVASIDSNFSLLKSMMSIDDKDEQEIKNTILRNQLHNILMVIEREYRLQKINMPSPILNVPNHVQQFKNLLNTHYQTQKQVAFYARELNITEKKLSQLVYDEHGLSAKEFINEKMLMEAIRLLENTTLNQEEIANEIGFEFNYFIKFFRKYKGMSPAKYKREMSTCG